MLNVNFNTKTPWSSGVALKIINILGGSEKTLVVGGAVRDWLTDNPVKDIDFASKFLPEKSIKLLTDAGFKVKPIGFDHGTIAVYHDNKSYEITTLRKDILTDGRHAQVVFGDDWKEDSLRRDFTFNSLYADEYGNIMDPTGKGFKDIENKILRFIGEPNQRIKEDYLRIIRYFRFLSNYADNIDKNSFKACINNAKSIRLLSSERIIQEFNKIFKDINCLGAINILIKYNLLQYIYSVSSFNNFKPKKKYLSAILKKLFNRDNLLKNPFLFFTSLMISLTDIETHDHKSMVKKVAKNLNFSKNDEYLMLQIILWVKNINNISKEEIYKAWLDFGKDTINYLKIIFEVFSSIKDKNIIYVLNNAPPLFPCSGQDAIKIGFKEGKNIGKALNNVREWWIKNDCKPSRKDCLKILKKEYNT
tara:strand:- start:29533 stop:30789 length:1257 start_codon:yes stop_codon:yes gene_type:complete